MQQFIKTLLCIICIHSGIIAQEISLSGKELFGDIKARHIGPALMSGRIIDLEGHPTNPRIIYAGTAGGGVWKSSNGGATFAPIFDKHAQSIGSIAVDPNDPDKTIWVGTGEIWTRNSVSIGDGLYRSKNGGNTWEKIGFEKSERISSIQINPKNSNEIYIGVLGALWGDSEERGVYKTTDGGTTWKKILYVNQKTGIADLLIDSKDPNILYASMWEFRRTPWAFNSGGENSALYKSTDGGQNWNKIHNGFPAGKLGRIGIAIAPSNTKVIYAAIEGEKDKEKGLYRSDNGGQSWKQLNNDFGLVVRPFYFSRLVVDPKNPDIVVKGGLFGSISRDGGKTFKNLGNMHADIHDILFDLNNSDRMYAATDGGVYRSWDGGTTMEIVENIPVSQFYQISVDNEEPYNVYGGLQDNGSWYGPSSSPGGVEARDWKRVGVGDGFRVLKHPTKPIIYSEMQGAQNVWRLNIEKNTRKNVEPIPDGDEELRFNWNAPMAVSTHQPDRFYMGSQFLHRSNDMGDNWTKISPDLTTNDPNKQDKESGGLSKDKSGAETHTTIFTIAESPIDQNVIWVGTDDGNVQVTRDGGKTWNNTVANIQGLPANTWVYHIEASVHNAGTAYAVFDGHASGDMSTYVYKTADYGKTWKSIVTDEIIGFARNIQEDYEQKDLLFLGTEFGLFVTINGGENWARFTNNMPATAVHFVDLQKNTSDLVLGTHGRGVIILDDISPLRQINQDILSKNVHFFKTKPGTILEKGNFGGGSKETQFVGANPSANLKIMYYLKKRHTFGKMSMEIQDMNGNKITTLSPGKSKGINIVRWNYRGMAPKSAIGKTLVLNTAPRVPAGSYKVILKKGKNTYEHTIEVTQDPNSIVTDSERGLQRKASKQLANISEDLAYLVYEIDETINTTKTVEDTATKIAKPVITELTSLKKSLVITTGDRYTQEAEPELAEKISNLFNTITESFEKPSAGQLKNINVLKKQFEKAITDFKKIKEKKVSKLSKYLERNQLKSITLKTKEEYLKQ